MTLFFRVGRTKVTVVLSRLAAWFQTRHGGLHLAPGVVSPVLLMAPVTDATPVRPPLLGSSKYTYMVLGCLMFNVNN